MVDYTSAMLKHIIIDLSEHEGFYRGETKLFELGEKVIWSNSEVCNLMSSLIPV